MSATVLVLAYDLDPVARAVSEAWGSLPSVGLHLEGAAVRKLNDSVLVVRRAGVHIHDEGVDRRLPTELATLRPTLVFPSIHRSERHVASLTVHPLGNPGASAELGGRPRALAPTDPLRMVSALRLLHEASSPRGIPSTYEATHHGPAIDLPAFFIEIGSGEGGPPPADAVRILSTVIPAIDGTSRDHVAMGVGGGHYVPHFTDLALQRSWAFGHLISRHALEELDRSTAKDAFDKTPGAEGVVFSRAQDSRHPAFEGVGRRLRDHDAPELDSKGPGATTGASRSASGT